MQNRSNIIKVVTLVKGGKVTCITEAQKMLPTAQLNDTIQMSTTKQMIHILPDKVFEKMTLHPQNMVSYISPDSGIEIELTEV